MASSRSAGQAWGPESGGRATPSAGCGVQSSEAYRPAFIASNADFQGSRSSATFSRTAASP